MDTNPAQASDGGVKLISAIGVRSGMEESLLHWNEQVSNALWQNPGFTSREVIPPQTEEVSEWIYITRFNSVDALREWRQSLACQRFIEEAGEFSTRGVMELVGDAAVQYQVENSVTEVILDQVAPGKEASYQEWANRIQRDQAQSPGYQGGYSQPPKAPGEGWMTLMRFSNVEALNLWLNSPVRKARLDEVKELIAASYQHRVDASFPGWAPSEAGKAPANWKTTMLVLAGLYPIVCLEMLFLMKHLGSMGLKPALAVFIGNAISVSLVAYGTMPGLCRALNWWLWPKAGEGVGVNVKGIALILFLYALSVAVFWWWI